MRRTAAQNAAPAGGADYGRFRPIGNRRSPKSLWAAVVRQVGVEPDLLAWYSTVKDVPSKGTGVPAAVDLSDEEKLRPRYQRSLVRPSGYFQIRRQRRHHSHLRHRRSRP